MMDFCYSFNVQTFIHSFPQGGNVMQLYYEYTENKNFKYLDFFYPLENLL